LEKKELEEKIKRFREARKAVILAHNYQSPEVQDIADFVGDSLELSRKAAASDAEIIVFCGVHFMAETAAILAPEKTVLLPDVRAGCPMADMITADELRAWKNRYPGRKVVGYVNTSAAVKAECDICCTSSNAVAVVNSLGGEEILFVPDRNLAAYAARFTAARIIAWDGFCYVHDRIRVEDVREKKTLHPGAEVWAHPECRPAVIDVADKALSTGKMIAEAGRSGRREFIVATEPGIIYRLKKENPEKDFYPASDQVCTNMKKIDLAKVLRSLEDNTHLIKVPADVAEKARGAIEKMIRI